MNQNKRKSALWGNIDVKRKEDKNTIRRQMSPQTMRGKQ